MSLLTRGVSTVVLKLRAARERASARANDWTGAPIAHRFGGSGALAGASTARSSACGCGTRVSSSGGSGGGARRRGASAIGSTGLFVAASCAWLLFFGVQAADAQIIQIGSFGAAGTGGGQFSSPHGVAVEQATGDVYVADSGNARVEKFDPSGNFLAAWGWGVTDGAGSSEVCTSSCQAGIAGSGAGQFSDPLSVAVDNNPGSPSYGDVYVADQANDVIEKFSSAGVYLSSLTGPDGGSFSLLTTIATDSAGNLWAYDRSANVDEFDSSGNTIRSWNANQIINQAFTVDANDNVYAGDAFPQYIQKFNGTGVGIGPLDPNTVTQTALGADLVRDDLFDAQGGFVAIYSGTAALPATPLATFGSGSLTDAEGVADNPATAVVYVVDASNADVQMFQLPSGPPSVDAESARGVTDTAASLTAQLSPNLADTTFHFEYGPTTSYGSSTAETDIGSGATDLAARAGLTGLDPAATYHWRVVATSPSGTTDGPDRTFTTYPSRIPAGLPDGRRYEMVTPPNKDNGAPDPAVFGAQVAVTGNAVSYASGYGFPGSQSVGISYLAQRGTSGWVSQNLVPPQSAESTSLCPGLVGVVGYSGDMSKAILVDGHDQGYGCGTDDPPLVSGEPLGVQNVFLRDNTTGAYQLVDVTPPGVTPSDAYFAGGSSDLSHVLFDSAAQLTPNAPSGGNLYEWVGGAVRLVTLVPAGSGARCTGAACTPVVGSLAGAVAGDFSSLPAVSSDGSRIYFAANGNLYLRQDGSRTVQVDAPASGAPGPGGGGRFMAASADGSEVFFTDDASAGLTGDTVSGSGANLYEYDVATGSLTDLTAVSQAQVQGVSGISDDGAYVYFAADGSLASGATAGQPNLYVRHGATTTFIATLSGSDGCDWSGCLTARVSSNGQFIAFDSIDSLTGYDNTDANTGSPDDEIFRYDAAHNELSCASCIPSGVPPTSGATVPFPENSGPVGSALILQRSVSDNGQVFFDTADALVPTDTNGARDVYEYEGGQPRLLSSGTDTADSLFFDATPDGSNVLFATAQQLVPQDTDGAYDIYDARVGGGFPYSAPPPSCQGESCKPPPTYAPAPPPAASVSFSGPGNAKPPSTATTADLRLLGRSAEGNRITLRLAVPAAGRIVITGPGLARLTRLVGHAGTYTVIAHLTGSAIHRLKRRRAIRLTTSVRYTPAAGGPSTVTVKLTVKA